MPSECTVCFTENPDNALTCSSCGSILENTTFSSVFHLPTGTTLKQGKYRIEKVLGEGGFGITYKGIDQQQFTTIAIKELRPEKAGRQGTKITWPPSLPPQEKQYQITKFKLEASNQKKCNHPNIAKVYDWFDENNTVYIVMEFIQGKSLLDLLDNEGILPEDRVKKYMIQVTNALKVVHRNKFLHRDIKPENILIDQRDRAILIDFGAAREFMAGKTKEMTQILSMGYAPIEQYGKKNKRFPATDIYALCASMYELLTGKLPDAATDRIVSDTLIPPRQLRPELSELMERVILTGMRIRVEERVQTADELLDALKGKFISPLQKKAREFVAQGNLPKAINTYNKCLANEPNNGEAAVELALVQIHLNDAQAEISAQTAVRLYPNDGRGYGVLGLVNCHQEKWSQAQQNLEQAARLSPQEAWIQANLAWALGKSGNWQQAETTVTKALQLDSNCTFTLGLRAWIAAHRQQWQPVVGAATKAILNAQQSPCTQTVGIQGWVYPYLIVALDKPPVTQQRTAISNKRIDEFISHVPNSAFVWGFKGWKQAHVGSWTDALHSFEQASQQQQVPEWALIDKAIVQEHLHDFQSAIQTYETCVQKFPHHAFVLFRLGTLLGRMKQWQKAKYYLEQAVQNQSDFAEAHHNLGWVRLNLRTSEEQITDSRELLASYRQAAHLYKKQGKIKLAKSIQQAFDDAQIQL